jgi:hypothetical protein
MLIPDGEIDVLAQDMIKHFPADAAERAALRSNALFVLGYSEKSQTWLLVTEEIKRIQAGASSQEGGSLPPTLWRRQRMMVRRFYPVARLRTFLRVGPSRKMWLG